MTKSRQELQAELDLKEALEQERKESNELYAIKLAERLIFGLFGLIAITVVGALIASILK
jgi:hypothetical protein